MAKGTRSSSKKKLNTWRRDNLKPAWQDKADAARFAALEQALAAPLPPRLEPEPEEQAAEPNRGREGAPRTKKQGKKMRAGIEVEDDADMEDASQSPERKGKKNGQGRGVQKKRRAGKLFLLGQKNQFHASKRTQSIRRKEKQTRQPSHK